MLMPFGVDPLMAAVAIKHFLRSLDEPLLVTKWVAVVVPVNCGCTQACWSPVAPMIP